MRNLFLILFLYPFFTLKAQEPIVAVLVDVSSNQYQKFQIANSTFICKPYGVITINKLYEQSSLSSECKDAISGFYKRHPEGKYYAYGLLKVKQMYRIEFKEDECLVYAYGQKTFSESLLEEGLALRRPKLKNDEFEAGFLRAQENAKIKRSGLWEENILRKCVVELYK